MRFWLLLLLSGCAPVVVPPSAHDQREALQLVDNGTRLLRSGELEQAEAAFQVSRELHPQAAAFDGLGCVEFRRGNLASARSYFEKALELDANYVEALAHLAAIFEREGKTALARGFYLKAIELSPQNVLARNNLGLLLAESGQHGAAESQLRAAAVSSRHPLVLENLRRILSQSSGSRVDDSL